MFFEILKASKGLYTDNIFAEMWGKRLAGQEEWQVTEITGYLPLTFLANGDVLQNYRLYGTSEGAGVQTESGEPEGYKIPLTNTSGVTENLWDSDITNITLHSINAQGDLRQAFVIDAPGTYAIKCYVRYGYVYGKTYSEISGEYSNTIYLSVPESSSIPTAVMTATIQDNEKIIIFDASSSSQTNPAATVEKFDASELCVVLGSTAPDHYIPHRYTADYNIYIGSSKLGEEEYVDYQEQKVYKRTENLFDKDAKDTDKGYVARKYLGSDGSYQDGYSAWSISEYIDVEPSVKYQYQYNSGFNEIYLCLYDENKQFISSIKYGNFGYTISFTTTADTKFVRVSILNPKVNETQLIKSNSVPSTYIPYLQPTDPPAPFPAITAYKGENTLSSTETVGEVTVRGKIKTAQGG